jgi:predicted DNA-binding transcriptional regulator YafY
MFAASGDADILRWILGYGHHAKVLEPPELAEKVKEATLRAAAAFSAEK